MNIKQFRPATAATAKCQSVSPSECIVEWLCVDITTGQWAFVRSNRRYRPISPNYNQYLGKGVVISRDNFMTSAIFGRCSIVVVDLRSRTAGRGNFAVRCDRRQHEQIIREATMRPARVPYKSTPPPSPFRRPTVGVWPRDRKRTSSCQGNEKERPQFRGRN